MSVDKGTFHGNDEGKWKTPVQEFLHEVSSENALKIWDWLQNRGGIAVWESANLSNPGASWTAPLRDEKGEVKSKPTWEAKSEPALIIHGKDVDQVGVIVWKEYKRFRVGLRMGGQGLSLKVTDGGSRRIRREVAKASEKCGDATYGFDYSTQECVISVPAGRTVPIAQYVAELERSSDKQLDQDRSSSSS